MSEVTIGPKPKAVAPPFQPPAAARPTGMPLPPGRMIKPEHLTDGERAVLSQIPGWKEGDAVPANLSEALGEIRSSLQLENLPPPVPLDTPPLQVPAAVDVTTLSAQQQQEVADLIKRSAEQHAQSVARASQEVAGAGPGVNAAIHGQNVEQIDLEDDTQAATYAGTDVPKPAPDAQTGLDSLQPSHCPHCHWQLDVPDVPDPKPAEKQQYLQSVLGLKPFEKSYELYGGAVHVTFRELQLPELDAIFHQASIKASQLQDVSEQARVLSFGDLIDRYRLSVQLKRLALGERVFNTPPTLAGWKASPAESNEDAVGNAADGVFSEIVTTESLGRSLAATLAGFCRLVAKLEVSADRPDFW